MISCPYCGSDHVTCINRATEEYLCLDCHEPFTEDTWEEEEEMDGGLGEDLFGEDW